MLDKPFVVGDFTVIDDIAGTVEYVGLKSTCVAAFGGQQVVISNSDLLKTRIHHHKRMQARRIDTPDYNRYMDIQQDINMALFQRFGTAWIAFANPTQTLRIEWVESGEQHRRKGSGRCRAAALTEPLT